MSEEPASNLPLGQTVASEAPERTIRARLRQWLRPPRKLKTTSLGKVVIAFTIVIGVAAINTGNNLLYLMLGGLFGTIGASGILSERVLKELSVRLRIPDVAVAGRRTTVGVELSSHKRVGSFLLEVTLLGDDETLLGEGKLRELEGWGRRRVAVAVYPSRRGALQIRGVRVGTRFPFQMYDKSRTFELPMTLWVAPQPTSSRLPVPQAPRRATQSDRASRRLGESEFRGLRERVDTDPPSRIHWKRSATIGRHMVKVFAAGTEAAFDVTLGRGASPEAFEEGLGTAAGYAEQSLRAGRPIRLVAGRQRVWIEDPATLRTALLILAKLERSNLPPGPVCSITYAGRQVA